MKTRIPPPLVALIFAGLMWLVTDSATIGQFHLAYNLTLCIAALLFCAGLAVMLSGLSAFKKSMTTVNPLKPETASSLVITGIYTRTRNPMYLGMILMLIALALVLGNLLAFLAIPLFILYMNLLQIIPEEQALVKLFGEPYENYLTTVRRWI